MKNWHIYIGLVVIIVVVLVLVRGNSSSTNPPEKVTVFDDFAQCVADSGALLYGAYWCPNCQDQKDMFDGSAKLSYIECSTVNRQQTKQCADAGITAYPTWVFGDGSREQGTIPMDMIAERTGCQLPG